MNENPEYSSLLGKIAAYTEILIKDPYSTIFVSLAETYRKLGMFDDAHQILLKGLEKHDDFASAYIVQGRIFCQQGQYEQSVEAFEKSLQLEPNSLAALVGYARVLILHERFSYARKLLLRARNLSPADPVINKLLISLPEERDVVSEPAEELDDNIDAGGQDDGEQKTGGLISVTLGDLYLKQGLVEDALKVFRQLSSQEPENLNLRRRIKEAEALLANEQVHDSGSSLEEKMEVDAHTTEEEDDHKSSAMDLPTELRVDANIINGDESQVETTVEILQRWLANIERRRKHV